MFVGLYVCCIQSLINVTKFLCYFFFFLTGQWQSTEVPCSVGSLEDTLLVRAQLERPVDVHGCTTNTLVQDNREIHVIQYHGNAEDNVELNMEDQMDLGKCYS